MYNLQFNLINAIAILFVELEKNKEFFFWSMWPGLRPNRDWASPPPREGKETFYRGVKGYLKVSELPNFERKKIATFP